MTGRRDYRRGGRVPQKLSVATRFAALFTANDGMYEAVAGSNVLTDRINTSRTIVGGGTAIANAAADSGFANKPVLSLDGTNYLASNQVSSYWPSLSNGAGGTLILVHQLLNADAVNRGIVATADVDGSRVGMVSFDQSTTGLQYFVVDGSNVTVPVNTGVMTRTTGPSYIEWSLNTSAYSVRQKSAVIKSGTPSATPSASSPQATLQIGREPSAASNFGIMKVRALYHWRRVLTAAERSLVQSYILADTGIVP